MRVGPDCKLGAEMLIVLLILANILLAVIAFNLAAIVRNLVEAVTTLKAIRQGQITAYMK